MKWYHERRFGLSSIGVCLAITALILTVSVAHASKPIIYTSKHNQLALNGFDTVAYFTQGSPRKGNPDISYTYKEAVWLFSSDKHRQMFIAEPERYAPQFGGYCAFSVAQGTALQGKPEYWQVHDNKLYLNRTANIHNRWLERQSILADRANSNWPAVLDGQLRSIVRQQLIEADRLRRKKLEKLKSH